MSMWYKITNTNFAVSASANIQERINNASTNSLVETISNIANGLYGFILSLSDSFLMIGIVIAIVALIIGIFTGIGRAIKVALAVILVYFIIIYAPDIIALFKSWIVPPAGTSTPAKI